MAANRQYTVTFKDIKDMRDQFVAQGHPTANMVRVTGMSTAEVQMLKNQPKSGVTVGQQNSSFHDVQMYIGNNEWAKTVIRGEFTADVRGETDATTGDVKVVGGGHCFRPMAKHESKNYPKAKKEGTTDFEVHFPLNQEDHGSPVWGEFLGVTENLCTDIMTFAQNSRAQGKSNTTSSDVHLPFVRKYGLATTKKDDSGTTLAGQDNDHPFMKLDACLADVGAGEIKKPLTKVFGFQQSTMEGNAIQWQPAKYNNELVTAANFSNYLTSASRIMGIEITLRLSQHKSGTSVKPFLSKIMVYHVPVVYQAATTTVSEGAIGNLTALMGLTNIAPVTMKPEAERDTGDAEDIPTTDGVPAMGAAAGLQTSGASAYVNAIAQPAAVPMPAMPAAVPMPQQPAMPTMPQQPAMPAAVPMPQQPAMPAAVPMPQQPAMPAAVPMPQQPAMQMPTMPQQPAMPAAVPMPQQPAMQMPTMPQQPNVMPMPQ